MIKVPISSAIRVAVPNPMAIPIPISRAGEGQPVGGEYRHMATIISLCDLTKVPIVLLSKVVELFSATSHGKGAC